MCGPTSQPASAGPILAITLCNFWETTMNDQTAAAGERPALDLAIDAAAALSGVTIADASRDSVRMHLSNSLKIAEAIGPVGPDAAPVFKP